MLKFGLIMVLLIHSHLFLHSLYILILFFRRSFLFCFFVPWFTIIVMTQYAVCAYSVGLIIMHLCIVYHGPIS